MNSKFRWETAWISEIPCLKVQKIFMSLNSIKPQSKIYYKYDIKIGFGYYYNIIIII